MLVVFYLKRSSLTWQDFTFSYSFLFYSISKNLKLSRRGKTWKREIAERWQATVVTHLPLGNPAIMLSGRIDLRERARQTVLWRQREVGMKVQKGRMFVSKSGWWDFIMLSERGDISVMLCSSLWHFKLIKASNNYADWKDGGWVDTLWANTLMNNAAISLLLSLSFFLSLFRFHPSFYQFLCDDLCISLQRAENWLCVTYNPSVADFNML